MSIHLILGPMFAGKSTELLRLADRNERAGLNVVYVKHQLDQKRHATKIRTHDGTVSSNNALLANDLMDIFDHLKERWVDVVCIDEGQFFNDLAPVAQLLANKHDKTVAVAALNATYKRHMFPSVAKLLPYVERLEWLTAICFDCKKNAAQFTNRLLPNATQCDDDNGIERELPEQVSNPQLIGGAESYESLCRKCLYRKLYETDPINSCR